MKLKINERNSNFELLRIVAMFLVLILHSDFLSLGVPVLSDFKTDKTFVISKIFVQNLSIVAVNLFILISGYWSITPKVKSIANLLFQVLFFSILIYFILIVFRIQTFTFTELIKRLLVISKYNWFISAYIGLILFSPVLNSYINQLLKINLNGLYFVFWFSRLILVG